MLSPPPIALARHRNPSHLHARSHPTGRACRPRDAPAVVTTRVRPVYGPPPYRLAPFTTIVRVTLSPIGSVESVVIERSSGSAAYDESTITAARMSRYAPRCANGRTAEGTTLYRASFGSGP